MSSSYSSNKKMNENHYTEKEVEQDSGVEALVLIARYHKIAADSQQIRHLSGSGKKQLTDGDLILAARTWGLNPVKLPCGLNVSLAKTPFPALALDRLGRHFIVTACDGTGYWFWSLMLENLQSSFRSALAALQWRFSSVCFQSIFNGVNWRNSILRGLCLR